MRFFSVSLIVLLCFTILLVVGFNKMGAVEKTGATQQISQTSLGKLNAFTYSIKEIPLPEGFKRVDVQSGSFAEWLRMIKLRKDNIVYLYNGLPIQRQDLHYAVLDISTGTKDLQQCADCIMRLQAEYFFQHNELNKICFGIGDRQLNFVSWLSHINTEGKDKHVLLLQFLETVFINCGTYTVAQMTKPVNMNQMQIGDVFLKAGAPGHAMIVVDIAENKTTGKKIYLLAQGYMPAQDMHIVINAANETISPWYEVNDDAKINTPGWVFERTQLRRSK